MDFHASVATSQVKQNEAFLALKGGCKENFVLFLILEYESYTLFLTFGDVKLSYLAGPEIFHGLFVRKMQFFRKVGAHGFSCFYSQVKQNGAFLALKKGWRENLFHFKSSDMNPILFS